MASNPLLADHHTGTARLGARRSWLPFAVAGTAAVLAGGFVAAAGGEDPTKHLAWASAYLVLVCGCSQLFVGVGAAALTRSSPSVRLVTWQLVGFNAGNAGVLAGTLSGARVVLYVASAVLVLTLASFAWSTAGARARRGAWLTVYRVVLVLLVISVPVGGVLRH